MTQLWSKIGAHIFPIHSRLEVRAPILLVVIAAPALLLTGGTVTFPTFRLVRASLLAAAVAGGLGDAAAQPFSKIITSVVPTFSHPSQ